MHPDDTPGHERDCSITTLVNLYIYKKYQKNMMIYTLESFKFTLCNGKSVCIQTKHHDTSQIVPSILQITYICTKYQTSMMIYTLESFKFSFCTDKSV